MLTGNEELILGHNDRPICSHEKEAQDAIDEQLFDWIEFLDNFSIDSNKKSRLDDSEVEAHNVSSISSKAKEFLNPSQKKYCESSKIPASNSAALEPDETTLPDYLESDDAAMEVSE